MNYLSKQIGTGSVVNSLQGIVRYCMLKNNQKSPDDDFYQELRQKEAVLVSSW